MKLPGLNLPESAAPYVALGGVVIVAALVVYFVGKSQISKGARAVGSAVNPTSSSNIFYAGTNEVARIIAGAPDSQPFSLGAWLYEKTHPQNVAAEANLSQPINTEAAIAGAYL